MKRQGGFSLKTKNVIRTNGSVLFLCLLLITGSVHAGNLILDGHGGYGVINYKEDTSSGVKTEATSTLKTVYFGGSGEYSFNKPENYYAGIAADWAIGVEDGETWTKDGTQVQTNDIKIFGQFYDLRFGYKDSMEKFSYGIYLSGGWDGMYFDRDNFVESGIPSSGAITEEFSLWRAGGGIKAGYEFGQWTAEGLISFAYYTDAKVENSKYPGFKFDTEGVRLDLELGAKRSLFDNLSLYLGGLYRSIQLDESPVFRVRDLNGILDNVKFPHSKTQIIAAKVVVAYAF